MTEAPIESPPGRAPGLSVILLTPDRYETIRETVRGLRAQTVKDRLELVIVAPAAADVELDEAEVGELARVQVVEIRGARSTGRAGAAGVRRADAPVVAFLEDHAYPDPGWAEALIGAHRQPWAAVGPVMRNPGPGGAIGEADHLLNCSPWLEPAEAGVVDHLPSNNSSYKRAVLLEYGPELDTMLEMEIVLHWDLRSRGYQAYLEPAAIVYHRNFSRLADVVWEQFHAGRLFAVYLSRDWSPLRRLLYGVGTPLVPPVRLWRILQRVRRSGRLARTAPGVRPIRPRPAVLAPLLVGLGASAVGQAVGYASGTGDLSRQIWRVRFHRRPQPQT